LYRAPSRDIMGSSPPNLTSSPPLASELETDRKLVKAGLDTDLQHSFLSFKLHNVSFVDDNF
ncbi:unnamed protein product, partial [Onchocerca ochengi]